MALDLVHIAIIEWYVALTSRNRYNYLSRLSEDDALERMKEVLNDENSDNNGNRNNDRNSSNNGNNSNDGNNSSEGGENHGC